MLPTESDAGVNWFHDYWTVVWDATYCGVHHLTVPSPHRNDQIRSLGVRN
jgi:hypothetical protein